MQRRYTAGVIAILFLMCLSGCESTELEQRSFPLAMGIGWKEEEEAEKLVVSYDFPDLMQISDQSQTADTPKEFSIEGKDMYHVEKAYENNTNRTLDYNHLKNILLEKDMLQHMKMLRKVLGNWEQQESIARNTSLFLTEPQAAQILALTKETEGSVGKYLEEMLESQKDFKNSKIVTVGDLMNQWHNQNELLLIPVLTEQGERPVITKYGMVSNFQYIGDVSVEEAMQVFLSQNLLKQFVCECKDGTTVEITDIKVERSIQEQQGIPVVIVSISGKGRIYQENEVSINQQYRLEQNIEQQLEFGLTKAAGNIQEKFGVDITNSYIALGGHSRKLYEEYRNMPETYGKTVQQVFQADISILNWE